MMMSDTAWDKESNSTDTEVATSIQPNSSDAICGVG